MILLQSNILDLSEVKEVPFQVCSTEIERLRGWDAGKEAFARCELARSSLWNCKVFMGTLLCAGFGLFYAIPCSSGILYCVSLMVSSSLSIKSSSAWSTAITLSQCSDLFLPPSCGFRVGVLLSGHVGPSVGFRGELHLGKVKLFLLGLSLHIYIYVTCFDFGCGMFM